MGTLERISPIAYVLQPTPPPQDMELALACGFARIHLQEMNTIQYLGVRRMTLPHINIPISRNIALEKVQATINELPPELKAYTSTLVDINDISPSAKTADLAQRIDQIFLNYFPPDTLYPDSLSELENSPIYQLITVGDISQQANFERNFERYITFAEEQFKATFALSPKADDYHAPSRLQQYLMLYILQKSFGNEANHMSLDAHILHTILSDDFFANVPQSLKDACETKICNAQHEDNHSLEQILITHGVQSANRILTTTEAIARTSSLSLPLSENPPTQHPAWKQNYIKMRAALKAKGSIEVTGNSPDLPSRVIASCVGSGNFIQLTIVFPDGAYILLPIDIDGKIYGIDKKEPGTNQENIQKIEQMIYAALNDINTKLFPPTQLRRSLPSAATIRAPQSRPIKPHAKSPVLSSHHLKREQLMAHLRAKEQRASAQLHERDETRASRRENRIPEPPQPHTEQTYSQNPSLTQKCIRALVGADFLKNLLEEFPHHEADFYAVLGKYFDGLAEHQKMSGTPYYEHKIFYHHEWYRIITSEFSVDGTNIILPIDVFKKKNSGRNKSQHVMRAKSYPGRIKRILESRQQDRSN